MPLRDHSYLEIDRSALRHNLSALRSLLAKSTKVTAVLKANAYGHGTVEVATAIHDLVDAFQFDDIPEVRRFRETGIDKPCWVLGYVGDAEMFHALAFRAQISVWEPRQVRALVAEAERTQRKTLPPVHLKVDSLLGRLGAVGEDVDALFDAVDRAGVIPATIYSHYANIEDTTDLTHAIAQQEVFETAYQKAKQRWPGIGRHLSATSGSMTVEGNNDWVRLGIGTYGLYPSPALSRVHAELDLRPALRWVSHLAQVKLLPAGHPVGYGLTYVTRKPTRIAIVPQGYSDGYDRGLSNVGEVLVAGSRCPVIGRVAMNMFAIDVTELPDVQSGDEVVLLGKQGSDGITAEEVAAKLGTINYEVVARISPLLERVLA